MPEIAIRGAVPGDDVTSVYRELRRTVLKTVRRTGCVRPGDRVVNYCCGAGTENVVLARLAGPHGAVHAVDQDADALARLRELARQREVELTMVCRDVRDALPGSVLTCFFGLHHLPDSDEVTRRWAAGAPGATLLTVDWGPLVPPGDPRLVAGRLLPAVHRAWQRLGHWVITFEVPPDAPVVLRRHGRRMDRWVPASAVIRSWRQRS